MGSYIDKKTLDVFSDVITRIVIQAVDDIDYVKLYDTRKAKYGISVDFLPSERVDVNCDLLVKFGHQIPQTVCLVQERVISEIEKVTKYKVHQVNINVVNVENN